MVSFKILSSLVFAQLAVAQNDYSGGGLTPTSAPATVPSAPPSTAGHINIDVAANGSFVFDPANVTAKVGDIVTFYFPGGQLPHSVTQSSFSNPCTHVAANGSTPAGFDSGLQLAVAFSINITNTNPIWFHCKQVGHCGMGMVGSINAPATGNTHEAFVAKALAIGEKEVQESDSGTPILTGIGAVATGPPSSEAAGSETSGATAALATGPSSVAGPPSSEVVVGTEISGGTGVELSGTVAPGPSGTGTGGARKITVKGGLYLAIAGVTIWMI